MKTNKLHSLLGVTVLALAGSIAASSSAHAANGDLYLGFRVTGGTGSTLDYLVDIGQASLYTGATGSFVINNTAGINIGNIGADLSSIYGANWATRNDLYWGIVGTVGTALGSDPANTEYASAVENPLGTQAAAWLRRSPSSQLGVNNKIANGLLVDYNQWTPTANSNGKAVVEDHTADPQNNYWSSYMIGGANAASGAVFNNYDGSLEGNDAAGVSNTALDLFRMQTSTVANLPGNFVGSFTTDTSGNITFNSATAVPEPASLMMLGLGGCLLGFVRRRQQAA